MNDCHYTPSKIAEQLVAAVECRRVTQVADFAVGCGELLKAAQKRWPKATYIGTDIDPSAIAYIRRHHPRWIPCQSDFLQGDKLEKLLRRKPGRRHCDVVLLNPPFSARKVKTVRVVLPTGETIECGRAIAFVVRALSYCRLDGQIVAILPSGSINSMRDAAAWKYLRGVCSVAPLFALQDDTFPECSASAEVFRFTYTRKATPAVRRARALTAEDFDPDVTIVRGSISLPATTLRRSRIRVIHTTELQDHKVLKCVNFTEKAALLDGKLLLLIPRVGKPRIDKICLYRPRENSALSDCVIGLVGRTESVTVALQIELIGRWEEFAKNYRGTGARYITIVQLGKFLTARGFSWLFKSGAPANRLASSVVTRRTGTGLRPPLCLPNASFAESGHDFGHAVGTDGTVNSSSKYLPNLKSCVTQPSRPNRAG